MRIVSHFTRSSTDNEHRDDVKAIFDPLIDDIERLVAEQVTQVKLKRMSGGVPDAAQVKVCYMATLCN